MKKGNQVLVVITSVFIGALLALTFVWVFPGALHLQIQASSPKVTTLEDLMNPSQMMQRHLQMMEDDFFQEPRGSVFTHTMNIDGLGELQEREDDHFVIYEIKMPSVDVKSLEAKVQGSQVVIFGETEKKNEDEGMHSYFTSNYTRSFPVPENVDAQKMQMIPEKDKLLLKFPKNSG